MAPEYGASMGFFPTDEETLANFLRLTGRGDQVPLVETYCKAQGLWRDDTAERVYSDTVDFDIVVGRSQPRWAKAATKPGTVEPGPSFGQGKPWATERRRPTARFGTGML